MRYSMIPALAAGCLFATAALADDARLLSDVQLDGVNAGATAGSTGYSLTAGDILSETFSDSIAVASAGSFALATNYTKGLATSVYFPAASASYSASAATLP